MTTASFQNVPVVCAMALLQFALPMEKVRADDSVQSVARDLISLRVACAESDLAVAQAEERLAKWRSQGRTRLFREGHGSWLEQADAAAAHDVAMANRLN